MKRTGYGLGMCPNPKDWYRGYHCGCDDKCKVCGYKKHDAVHMHLHGGKPGDPPYDHEFVSAKGNPIQPTEAGK